MKHDQIVSQLVQDAEHDPNIAGRLLFGSIATGTHRADSDVDVITILTTHNPPWGIDNAARNGPTSTSRLT